MDNKEKHPLVDLLVRYYEEFPKIKDEHQDEAPLAFNQSYGLYLDVPSAWPWLEALQSVVALACSKLDAKIVVIYPTTTCYDDLSDALYEEGLRRNPIFYVAWHEIYAAMHMVSQDSRLFKALRDKISSATVCLFVGATKAPQDVVDQVRGLTEGCLIIIG